MKRPPARAAKLDLNLTPRGLGWRRPARGGGYAAARRSSDRHSHSISWSRRRYAGVLLTSSHPLAGITGLGSGFLVLRSEDRLEHRRTTSVPSADRPARIVAAAGEGTVSGGGRCHVGWGRAPAARNPCYREALWRNHLRHRPALGPAREREPATAVEAPVLVRCCECGDRFQLSARNMRANRRRGTLPRCRPCRLPGMQTKPTAVMRVWWL